MNTGVGDVSYVKSASSKENNYMATTLDARNIDDFDWENASDQLTSRTEAAMSTLEALNHTDSHIDSHFDSHGDSGS